MWKKGDGASKLATKEHPWEVVVEPVPAKKLLVVNAYDVN